MHRRVTSQDRARERGRGRGEANIEDGLSRTGKVDHVPVVSGHELYVRLLPQSRRVGRPGECAVGAFPEDVAGAGRGGTDPGHDVLCCCEGNRLSGEVLRAAVPCEDTREEVVEALHLESVSKVSCQPPAQGVHSLRSLTNYWYWM